jgi:hypothetical protein
MEITIKYNNNMYFPYIADPDGFAMRAVKKLLTPALPRPIDLGNGRLDSSA